MANSKKTTSKTGASEVMTITAVGEKQNSLEVLLSSVNDSNVAEVIKGLKDYRKSLIGDTEERISTDITVQGTNIKSVTKHSDLIKLTAVVQSYNERYKAAAESEFSYLPTIPPCKLDGNTPAQINAAIQKRSKEILNETKIAGIDKAIKGFEETLTADQKRRAAMEEASKAAIGAIE